MSSNNSPSVKELIQSGEYYTEARKWYYNKYLTPLTERTITLIIASIFFLQFILVAFTLYSLYPIIKQIRYSLYASSYQSTAVIKIANQIKNNSYLSIADILLRSYLTTREQYNYNDLKKQFIYVQNSSTRIVFRKFYNYMSIDNVDSPVMRYQKLIRRSVNILSAKYNNPGEAIIKFQTIAKTAEGQIFEDIVWEATINYNIENINLQLPPDSRYTFVVTDYQLKLLENKTTNK